MVHITLFLSFILSGIKKNKKILFLFSFVMLFIFAAFRFEYGNDYLSYYTYYLNVKHGFTASGFEALYVFLNKIIPNFQLLIALISFVYLLSVYHLINKHVDKKYVFLSVFIFLINPYLFLMSLSSIRQSVAISLFILATYFSFKRQFLKYVFIIVLATLFHKSALILFPLYFLANGNRIKNVHIAVYSIALIVLLIFPRIFFELVGAVLELFDSKKYLDYFENITTNSLRATILTLITLVYVVFNIKKLQGFQLMCAKLYLLGLACGVLAFNFSMLTRIQMYFDIFSIVALPAIIKINIEKPSKDKAVATINNIIFPLLILAVYLLRYYSFFTNPLWEDFFVYKTIFN